MRLQVSKSGVFDLLKYSELIFFKLIMTEVSRNLRNIFFRKIHPILKLEVGFLSDRKSFSQIFEITAYLSHLQFISIKKNRETFSRAKTPDFSTLSRIFLRLKQFFAHFPNYSKFIYYKLIMSKFSSKSEQLFPEVGSSRQESTLPNYDD